MAKRRVDPMMKQFYDLKSETPPAIMLFRCGDFYENFIVRMLSLLLKYWVLP